MGQDWVGAALDGLRDYGPAALFVIAALGGIGVPAPVTVTLLAAGAVARQGGPERVFLFLAAATAGATVGDGISYAMGRWGLGGMRRRLERSRSWNRAREALEARGGTAAVLLTRFLLTPLALPTNLLCGGDRYPFLRFAGLCAVGHVIYQVGIGASGTRSGACGPPAGSCPTSAAGPAGRSRARRSSSACTN
jgi:membrane protein DedA with SNARE-associated domain